MKFRRSSTRHLLLLIAVAGLGSGMFAWMNRRVERFRAEARRHQQAYLGSVGSNVTFPPRPATTHHRLLAEKYRLAVRRPWLPVAPDPPEPD